MAPSFSPSRLDESDGAGWLCPKSAQNSCAPSAALDFASPAPRLRQRVTAPLAPADHLSILRRTSSQLFKRWKVPQHENREARKARDAEGH